MQKYINSKQQYFTEVIFFPKDNSTPFNIPDESIEEQLSKVKIVTLIKDDCSMSVGDDGIVILGKRGKSYPKLSTLLDFAKESLPYITNQSYSCVGLVYVDDIYLPIDNTSEDLNQFISSEVIQNSIFNIPVQAFDKLFTLSPIEESDECTFRCFIPKKREKGGIRVQFRWRYSIVSKEEETFDNYTDRLHKAREYIVDCFEKAITDKCRELFYSPFKNYSEEM